MSQHHCSCPIRFRRTVLLAAPIGWSCQRRYQAPVSTEQPGQPFFLRRTEWVTRVNLSTTSCAVNLFDWWPFGWISSTVYVLVVCLHLYPGRYSFRTIAFQFVAWLDVYFPHHAADSSSATIGSRMTSNKASGQNAAKAIRYWTPSIERIQLSGNAGLSIICACALGTRMDISGSPLVTGYGL